MTAHELSEIVKELSAKDPEAPVYLLLDDGITEIEIKYLPVKEMSPLHNKDGSVIKRVRYNGMVLFTVDK